MNVLLLILVMFSSLIQSVSKKQYQLKAKKAGVFLFNAMTTFSAGIFFLCTDKGGFSFDPALFPYILAFAASYGSAVLFSFFAIQEGPLSLTALATSYSLIIPTCYGILFLNESVSLFLGIGLVFLCISLFLVNETKGGTKITPKWILYALLAFLGNGFCSAVQTSQQIRFGGQYKSEFMILALAILSLFFFLVSFLRENREEQKFSLQCGILPMILSGVANGMTNLFVMLLVSRGMSASIMFPVISGGGILLAGCLSLFVYKEPLSKKQILGLLLGTVSVVLMNL